MKPTLKEYAFYRTDIESLSCSFRHPFTVIAKNEKEALDIFHKEVESKNLAMDGNEKKYKAVLFSQGYIKYNDNKTAVQPKH